MSVREIGLVPEESRKKIVALMHLEAAKRAIANRDDRDEMRRRAMLAALVLDGEQAARASLDAAVMERERDGGEP